MSGVMTGALVGAVMAGVWILNRSQPNLYQRAFRQAKRLAPTAYRVARVGGRELVHFAKRRMG